MNHVIKKKIKYDQIITEVGVWYLRLVKVK